MKVHIALTMGIISTLAMVAGSAMAARWEKSEVPVWDYTPDEWRPAVQATVDDFNANLPDDAPQLSYIPMGELPCSQLPRMGRKDGITVCVQDNSEGESDANVTYVSGRIYRSLVSLDPVSFWQANITVCHEMMHSLTNVSDDTSLPQLDTSCVMGNLDRLGLWDIAYLAQVYGKPHRHQSKHRN